MTIKPAQFDKAFSRLVARRGLMSTDEIYKVARIAVTRREMGEPCTMADVCRELMFLGRADIDELSGEVRLVTFDCPNPECGANYRVVVYGEVPTYACRQCGTTPLAPRDEGELAEPLVTRDVSPRRRPGEPRETTRRVSSGGRRRPRSMTSRLERADTESRIKSDTALVPLPAQPGVTPSPASPSGPSAAPAPGAAPAPMPGADGPRTRRRTDGGRPAPVAPMPAPAPARPAAGSKAGATDSLLDLPEMRAPDDKRDPAAAIGFGASEAASHAAAASVASSPDPAALEAAGDDAYSPSGLALAHPGVGTDTALLDDRYDTFSGLIETLRAGESNGHAPSGPELDGAVFEFDDIGLVDIAAVEAETAAERAASGADPTVRLPGMRSAAESLEAADLPPVAQADDEDPGEDDFSFDFEDDDAFSAALQDALDDDASSSGTAGDRPPTKEEAEAHTADLLAAIAEVEDAFMTGNVEKKGPDLDPFGDERKFSVNVASPHIDTFRPPEGDDDDDLDLLAMDDGGGGSSSDDRGDSALDDVADPLASSLELPPPSPDADTPTLDDDERHDDPGDSDDSLLGPGPGGH